MTFGEALRAATAKLQGAQVEDPIICAKQLLCSAAGIDKVGLITRERDTLPGRAAEKYHDYIGSRIAGKPVGLILGNRQFFDCEIEVNEHVLEPRVDSEILVECVIDHYGKLDTPLRFADMGTGSGALAIAICQALPNANCVGLDISDKALEVAARNIEKYGLDRRIYLQQSNWLESATGKFDFLISNPPYIASAEISELSREVREHDPVLALDGGVDGLDAYRAIFLQMSSFGVKKLCEGGFIFLEIGHDQAQSVRILGENAGWQFKSQVSDLGGNDRVLVFEAPTS